MEVKLGALVCNIVSMTITTTNSLLHSSLTVARMEVKLGVHVYYMDSMTIATTNSVRHFCLKLLLHSLTNYSPYKCSTPGNNIGVM